MSISSTSWLLESWGFEGLDYLPDKIDLPVILVSPEKIFSNEVALLDVNIINPNRYENPNDGTEVKSAVQIMQETIASWYVALRNLAIVGLLSVLVYVGIRIVISSTASDKAKYKQMLIDWIVALCLLFFMHYIMSFTFTMVEALTESIKQTNQSIEVPINVDDIKEKYNEGEYGELLDKMKGENGGYVTDLMGLARFKAQLNYAAEGREDDVVAEGGRAQMAYTIIYAVLVIYTIMYLFIYIKRMVYIIFLTMISPLVALTYPIDKISDGQAQAFNMWLKEFIFNILIQPLHLLIYNILLGSTMDLAAKYMIYPLVVLGFMLSAEKILRRFFGFEKSSTASSIASGALGGAAVMTAINKLGSGAKKAVKGGKGGGTSQNGGNNDRIRMAERTADDSKEEDNFINDALNGPTNTPSPLDLPGGGESPQLDNNRQNDPFFDQSQGGPEELTPEELAEQDPNFMYMHPELFNYGKESNEIDPEVPQTDGMANRNINNNKHEDPAPNINLNNNNEEKGETKNKGIKGAKTLWKKSEGFRNGVKALGGRYVAPNLGKAGLGVLKGTAKGIGAATLGTIGIAAGLASDDYANVPKYAVAAGAIGSGIGGNIGNKMINLPSNAYRKGSEFVDTYRQGAYTQDQYQKLVNRRLDHEFIRNKENQQLYREKFGTTKMTNGDGQQVEAYKVAMEKALEYRKQGVTDNNTIIKAMKVQSRYASGDWADRRRIVSAKFASQVSNEKDVENLQKRLKEKGIAEDQIKDQADMVRKIRKLY